MKRFVVLATATLLPACAAPGSHPSVQTVRNTTTVSSSHTSSVTLESYREVGAARSSVRATPEEAWEALPKVYEGLSIPVGTSIPASFTLGNLKLELSRTLGSQRLSNFISCGEGPLGTPLADSYRVTMSVITKLAPDPSGGTTVETRVLASAANRATSSGSVECGSTGRLEAMIAERLGNHVM